MGTGLTSSSQTGGAAPSIGYDPTSTNNQAATGATPSGGAQSYSGPNQPFMGAFNQSYPMMPFQPQIGSKGYFPTQQPFSMLPNYMYAALAQRAGLNPYMQGMQQGFARGGRVQYQEDPIKITAKIAKEKLGER